MIARLRARLLAWIRNELRLLGLETWADGAYELSPDAELHGPPDPRPCTGNDPRCAAMAEAQAALYRRMKREKVHAEDWELGCQYLKTNVRATFDAARRAANPPVRLIGRRAK